MINSCEEILNMISDFPVGTEIVDKKMLGAKIKIIAYLIEDGELARRGIYVLDAVKQTQDLLCELTGYNKKELPDNIDDSLNIFNLCLDDFKNIRNDIEKQAEYNIVFDYLAQKLTTM